LQVSDDIRMSKHKSGKGGAEKEDVLPFVGAKVRVRAESNQFCEGRLLSFDAKGDCWHIRYSDGRKDQVRFPDPCVQILPQRRRSFGKSTAEQKENVGVTVEEASQAIRASSAAYAVGCLVHVLFDDGVKYLGKIIQKNASSGAFTIVFEDGEEHILPLPHDDVELADTQKEIERWEAEISGKPEGKRKLVPVPWWCNSPMTHLLETDSEESEPLRWRRLMIKPPAKPKGQRKVRSSKAKDPSRSQSADDEMQETAPLLKAEGSGPGIDLETEDKDGSMQASKKLRRKRQSIGDRDSGDRDSFCEKRAPSSSPLIVKARR
jgi:hypothetical protein